MKRRVVVPLIVFFFIIIISFLYLFYYAVVYSTRIKSPFPPYCFTIGADVTYRGPSLERPSFKNLRCAAICWMSTRDQRSREVLGHARDGQRQRGEFWSYSNGLFVNIDARLLRSDEFRRRQDLHRYLTQTAASTGALEKLLGHNRDGK